ILTDGAAGGPKLTAWDRARAIAATDPRRARRVRARRIALLARRVQYLVAARAGGGLERGHAQLAQAEDLEGLRLELIGRRDGQRALRQRSHFVAHEVPDRVEDPFSVL